jgi:hypothetical protein
MAGAGLGLLGAWLLGICLANVPTNGLRIPGGTFAPVGGANVPWPIWSVLVGTFARIVLVATGLARR